MQEKISALMDGELNAEEAAVLIAQFKNTEELREHWVAYHLISDAFGQSELKPLDVTRRINARLASEPAVLVTPTVRPVTKRRPVAYAAAASIAAVVVGGWMSLQTAQAPQSLQQNLADSQSTPVAPVAAYPAVPTDASISASAPAQINDYLLAHREFSPSTAIHGVVPYMRAAVESHENIGR
jgi:sigma-E factor negative regulatory protein RseA